VDDAVRFLVRERAAGHCEYCRLSQNDAPFRTFHIDHIRPRNHGGSDNPSNLALACDRCSVHKGYDLTGIDDETGEITPLFNPRMQAWADHFRFDGVRVIGLTPTGRTTVQVCNMNSPRRLQLRSELQAAEPNDSV
jgi:hypothetical protein